MLIGKRWFEATLLSSLLVCSSCFGAPVELEFSRARAEKVVVSENASKISLDIEFKAPSSQRPAVGRAIGRTDARILVVRALNQYLNVPSDHELVLVGFQVEEGRIEGEFYRAHADIDRSRISISLRRADQSNKLATATPGLPQPEQTAGASEPPQEAPSLQNRTSDGLPKLSRDSSSLVISKELRELAPKMPGLRSQALVEYTARTSELFESLTTHFPKTVEIARYKDVLRACGEDITDLTNTLKREASGDLRLTKSELSKAMEKIEAEVIHAYEALEKVQPQ
jgi:hypothetical protein